MKEWLQYYKPSGKAWLAVSIIGLCIVAIVYVVVAADINVEVDSAIRIKVETGKGAQAINQYFIEAPHKIGM